MMIRFFAILFLIPLTACGAINHGPTQAFTVLTPGAENARCMVYTDEYKVEMYGNSTRKIMRSEKPLTIDCYAPGNREKSIVVESEVTNAGYGNVSNLGLGALYDYADNSLFGYPAEVTVSFAGMNQKAYPLPEHHANDLVDSSAHSIESYGARSPVLEGDALKPTHVLQKKGWDDPVMDNAPTSFDSSSNFTPMPSSFDGSTSSYSAPAALPKNTSDKSADSLTRSMNPHVFQ